MAFEVGLTLNDPKLVDKNIHAATWTTGRISCTHQICWDQKGRPKIGNQSFNGFLGKFHHDLTVLPSPGIIVNKWGKSYPFMAARFRLVKYDNLPRWLWKKAGVSILGYWSHGPVEIVDFPIKNARFFNGWSYGIYGSPEFPVSIPIHRRWPLGGVPRKRNTPKLGQSYMGY